MTTEHEASRTLVKSPPELWAECSDAGSLARHLGEFGEITITRLEPETTVAWEGEHASGTVRIEPSGWGTRVTLTAQARSESVEVPADAPQPVAEEAAPPTDASLIEDASSVPSEEENHERVEETLEDPHPAPVAETGAFRIRWRRMRERMRGALRAADAEVVMAPETSIAEEAPPSLEPQPAAVAEPEAPPPPEPEAEPELNPEVILTAALDSLGQAHHRPFSRA